MFLFCCFYLFVNFNILLFVCRWKLQYDELFIINGAKIFAGSGVCISSWSDSRGTEKTNQEKGCVSQICTKIKLYIKLITIALYSTGWEIGMSSPI